MEHRKEPWTAFRKWEVPKIRGTILGIPIIKTIVFWGLHWDPPNDGNYQTLVLQLGVRL